MYLILNTSYKKTMKKRSVFKKVLVVALTACMAFLTACGGGKSPSTEPNDSVTKAPVKDKTKITFWAPFSGGDGDIMTALVDEFNDQSQTTEVEFMIIKSEEYYTKLLAAMTSDSSPTVAINHITRIKEYVTDDLLEPLDGLSSAAGVEWTDFTERLQQASKVNDVPYCMPIDTHLLLMHFNTDEFQKIGLLEADGTVKVPEGEDAFFEFFNKVKDESGKMPLSGTSMNGLPMYLWYTLLTQFGGNVCDVDGKVATLDSDANKKALEIMMKMVDSEIWPKNQKNGAELFTGNIAVATINGNWAIPTFTGTSGLNFASMAFPQLGTVKSVYADSHTLVMPKNANMSDEEKTAGMEFMKWITDNTLKWAQSGHIPSRVSVMESAEFKALPHRANYAESANYASFYPQISGIAGLTEMTYRELAAMVAGEQDVAATMDNMQQQFQKILDSYNK
ncbi:MAG: transporter substrate-binding protein [Herbinix sp.]|nr:transporter substrate-binding protein [Herbinix sp.]